MKVLKVKYFQDCDILILKKNQSTKDKLQETE